MSATRRSGEVTQDSIWSQVRAHADKNLAETLSLFETAESMHRKTEAAQQLCDKSQLQYLKKLNMMTRQIAAKSSLEIQIKEKLAAESYFIEMNVAAEKCTTTLMTGIDECVSSLRKVEEFMKTEKETLENFMEFGPYYRDITEIVENEASISRRISNLQAVTRNFDRRSEKKLHLNLAEQLKAIEPEILKQKHFIAIQTTQLSHVEAALDSQAESFESEFEASSNDVRRLQEEKNSLYVKEMALRKNIQRMTTTLNARAKRINAKGGM